MIDQTTTTPEAGKRKRRMERVQPSTVRPLTPSQREMLQLIHDYGFITRRLLTAAYGASRGGKGQWHIGRELRSLFDAGYIERFNRPRRPIGEGSDQYIYTITRQGGRLILDPADYHDERHDIYHRARQDRANFEHHLAVATLRYIVLHADQPWQVVEFQTDDRDPAARRSIKVGNRKVTVWPDARCVIEFPGEGEPAKRRLLVIWELDLNRKNTTKTGDRFTAYANWLPQLRKEKVREVNNVLTVFAGVDAPASERLRTAAGEALDQMSSRDRPQFLFWSMGNWYRDEMLEAKRSKDAPPHRWTVPVLRPPHEIMSKPTFTTLSGDNRQLLTT